MCKLFTRLLITVFISILFIGCQDAPNKSEGEIEIKDLRNAWEPPDDLKAHKPFDIYVYRCNFPIRHAYGVTYYQNEKGTLNLHKAYYGTDEDFNKAAYKWVNDTTVSITLVNENTNKRFDLKVYGNGGMNGISIDK